MPATIQIKRYTGSSGSPTGTDITSLNTRANAADAHSTNDTSNPVQIPAGASISYSYWVTTQLYAVTSPSGTINNIKWYSDGTNNFGTGITCVGNTANAYVQATGTPGQTGAQLTTGAHSGLAGTPTNVFASGYTSGSPKSVTGSISSPTTGAFGDFFVYQIVVDSTATAGTSATETFTWKYDET